MVFDHRKKTPAALQTIGTVVGLVGTTGGIVGSLWHLLLPTPDANIGAGMLVIAGAALALAGAALVIVRLGRARSTPSR